MNEPTAGQPCPHCGALIDNRTLGKMWGNRMKPLLGHRQQYNRFAALSPEERKVEATKAINARWARYRAEKTAKAQAAQREMSSAEAPKPAPSVIDNLNEIDRILKEERGTWIAK